MLFEITRLRKALSTDGALVDFFLRMSGNVDVKEDPFFELFFTKSAPKSDRIFGVLRVKVFSHVTRAPKGLNAVRKFARESGRFSSEVNYIPVFGKATFISKGFSTAGECAEVSLSFSG